MEIKFLKQKETKEILIYLVIFIVAFNLLMYFRGFNLTFDRPTEITLLEEEKDFMDIKRDIENIEEKYGFDRFRPFDLIPPFTGEPGRENPFVTGRGEVVVIEGIRGVQGEIVPVRNERDGEINPIEGDLLLE